MTTEAMLEQIRRITQNMKRPITKQSASIRPLRAAPTQPAKEKEKQPVRRPVWMARCPQQPSETPVEMAGEQAVENDPPSKSVIGVN